MDNYVGKLSIEMDMSSDMAPSGEIRLDLDAMNDYVDCCENVSLSPLHR